ncbi:hypothetical protein [Jannaschia formosa]|uniref:hypothetical protein n=1 Tax=Jannaschia formosa TaxID=2259592 RepID=UPI001074CD0F|nr:hypothetical protein [Jannaschia formosa]TFL17230.1 hypothetical protein DR046_15470 [Jannaschia formosa]
MTPRSKPVPSRAAPRGDTLGPDTTATRAAPCAREGGPMGEGLYRHPDGRTVYVEPFEDIDPGDDPLAREAWRDLGEAIASRLSDAWERVPRAWKRSGERIAMRNGLHEVWLHEDSCARVHVTFGIRGDLPDTDALARATMFVRAEAFFDRLACHYDLRVRTSAWTSARRVSRKRPT